MNKSITNTFIAFVLAILSSCTAQVNSETTTIEKHFEPT